METEVVFERVAPVIPVRDVDAAVERYRRLGFQVEMYGGPTRYAFVDRGPVSMHLQGWTGWNHTGAIVYAVRRSDDHHHRRGRRARVGHGDRLRGRGRARWSSRRSSGAVCRPMSPTRCCSSAPRKLVHHRAATVRRRRLDHALTPAGPCAGPELPRLSSSPAGAAVRRRRAGGQGRTRTARRSHCPRGSSSAARPRYARTFRRGRTGSACPA